MCNNSPFSPLISHYSFGFHNSSVHNGNWTEWSAIYNGNWTEWSAIYNGNWTEWSAIWAEIIRVISKSIERAARLWFEITSMISYQNCTIARRGSITTLLRPFWNRPNTGLGHFKYFIDAALSRFEIKFIHFLGGKSKSFRNKSSKICHTILFVYHFPAIWLVTLNKPWNLIGCFVFSVACSLAGKKMWFKAKNGAIRE